MKDKSFIKNGALGGSKTVSKKGTDVSRRQVSRTTRIIDSCVKNVAGSGNGPMNKGDKEVLNFFLFEEKATTKEAIRITKDMITKISREAMECGKVPSLIASLENLPAGVYQDWLIIPLEKAPWYHIMKEVKRVRS